MGNKNEMKKLAAYKRLCKLASAAKVAKYKWAMAKVAGDEKGPGFFDTASDSMIAGLAFNDPEIVSNKEKKEKAVKALRKLRTYGYIGTGVVPAISTLGGTGLGYGLGRLFGRKGGTIGAALGGGLGLGISALPAVGLGMTAHTAGNAAKRLESDKYNKELVSGASSAAAQLKAMRDAP